jgi:nucleotide-binding universal stress UspA family protein
MKKILVPCDFSDSAVQAFKFAVEIANQSKGEIALLNVVEIPVIHENVMMPTFSFEDTYLKEMKDRADIDFAKMKSKWAKDGLKVSTHVEYGAPTPTISKFIKEKKIDLVIMGTKGASGLKEFFVGSNTEKIVRWSPVPVISLKESVKASSIKNIVFPSMLHEDEEELTMRVKALQDFFKAKLNIIYVNTPANFRTDVTTHKMMQDYAERFMLKDYTLNIFNDLNEESGVAHFVNEIKGDMVAMSTHGRTILSCQSGPGKFLNLQ